MAKVNLGSGIVNFPMPVAVIGSTVAGKANFMTAAWVSMVSYSPAKLAVTLGNHHHTNKGIKENETFSICFPSTEHMKIVDLAGLVSGEKVDKSTYFTVFYGQSDTAPLIEEFSLSVECKLDKIVESGKNEIFIGDIVGIHADEKVIVNGKIDLEQLNPLLLGQMTTEYRSLGNKIGQAWKIGRE